MKYISPAVHEGTPAGSTSTESQFEHRQLASANDTGTDCPAARNTSGCGVMSHQYLDRRQWRFASPLTQGIYRI